MNLPAIPAPGTGRIVLPQAANPEVSLLIPTTNQAEALETCLTSLSRHLPPEVACEVIVVLNAATPEVRDLVRNRCTGLREAASAANLGVAGGYNLARSLARGRFLMLLHDDVEIGPLWLEPLLATAAAHPEAGAVGSRVLHPDGSLQRDGSVLWRDGLTTPAELPLDQGPLPVDYCGTCSTLVRTALWDALGGMDEQIYPAYYVDVDLAMRLRQLGSIVLCDPASSLRHRSTASSPSGFREFFCQRNREYFTAKWAATLADYEPLAPDDPQAHSRARARTMQEAAALAAHWHALPAGPPPGLDRPAQELWHFQKAIGLEKAWSRCLDQRRLAALDALAKARSDQERLERQLAEKSVKIRELKTQCGELKARYRNLKDGTKRPPPAGQWKQLRNRIKALFVRPQPPTGA